MYYILDFIQQIGCALPLRCRFWKCSLLSGRVLRSITNDSGRADNHGDDHVGELDSEDPPRIHNHPQHRRRKRNPWVGRDWDIAQLYKLFAPRERFWLELYVSGKEGLLAWAWRVEIIEILPRILFSIKWYMSTSVISCRSTRDILRIASQARPRWFNNVPHRDCSTLSRLNETFQQNLLGATHPTASRCRGNLPFFYIQRRSKLELREYTPRSNKDYQTIC